ncbi:hypothetical protein DFH09DRAFT_1267126 [Mycena vulgaris]|nr:hypothetical protein DFH09DRAFT_1267126 [Mycena vulgaris]
MVSSDIPPVIGSVRKSSGRTLILCFDGTGDSFDDDNSNIVDFFSMLDRDNPEKQLVYYQTGIGTTTHPGFWSPLMISLSKIADKMFAWNIGSHVMDGYKFLMQNYRADDRICLFGFSRGAYTARVLGGMLHKVGLLPPGMTEQVKSIWQFQIFLMDLYARSDLKSFADARVFKKAFCRQVPINIEFIGVWDTVSSVRSNKGFAFTANNLLVKTVRHAVALDEHRGKFKPNWWGTQTWDTSKPKLESGHNPKTDVQQVWFSGAHCDVGGGSVLNGTRYALSRIPLRWMIRECFATNTGIRFEAVKLRTAGLDPATLYPEVLKRNDASATTGMLIRAPVDPDQVIQKHDEAWKSFENDEEELGDCLSPLYDQFELKWYWKAVELVTSWNLVSFFWERAPGRKVNDGALVHRSVKMRMESAGFKQRPGAKYTPRAGPEAGPWPPKNIQWVA